MWTHPQSEAAKESCRLLETTPHNRRIVSSARWTVYRYEDDAIEHNYYVDNETGIVYEPDDRGKKMPTDMSMYHRWSKMIEDEKRSA